MALLDMMKMQYGIPGSQPPGYLAGMMGNQTSPAGATPGFNPQAGQQSPPPGGAPSAGTPPAAPAGGGGFMDKLRSPQGAGAMMALAASLQGMSHNKNPGFQNAMQMGIQQQMTRVNEERALKQATEQANMTADYFDKVGQPDIANQIRMNPSSAPEALAAFRDSQMKKGQIVKGSELPTPMTGPGADRYYNLKADGTATLINDGTGGGINITNEGSVPSGHVRTVDPVTGQVSMLPAPGTKAHAEMQDRLKAAESRASTSAVDYEAGQNTVEQVREGFEKSPDLFQGGDFFSDAINSGVRRLKAWAGGGVDAELESAIKTIKSQQGFDELKAIKESSPTGAGVGSLSEREFDNMASKVAELNLKLGKETNLKNLQFIAEKRFNMVHGSIADVTAAYKRGEFTPEVYNQYLQAWSQTFGRKPPEGVGAPGVGPGSDAIGWTDLGNGVRIRQK